MYHPSGREIVDVDFDKRFEEGAGNAKQISARHQEMLAKAEHHRVEAMSHNAEAEHLASQVYAEAGAVHQKHNGDYVPNIAFDTRFEEGAGNAKQVAQHHRVAA